MEKQIKVTDKEFISLLKRTSGINTNFKHLKRTLAIKTNFKIENGNKK